MTRGTAAECRRAHEALLALGIEPAEATSLVRDQGPERIFEVIRLSESGEFQSKKTGAEARDENEQLLRHYLHQHAHLAPGRPWPYQTDADLLLQHGTIFHVEPYDRQPYELGEIGYCFYNAYSLVLRYHARGLQYAEGYALSRLGVPVHHAWVVEPDGRAFDVTWKWSERSEHHRSSESALLGVIVPWPTLEAHWRTCGTASVLDDHRHEWPALRVPYDEWETELTMDLTELREEHCLVLVASGKATLNTRGIITVKTP